MNYFVLLGGQDGWLSNPELGDQVALWQRGEYVRMPLTDAAVRQWAHQVDRLAPLTQ